MSSLQYSTMSNACTGVVIKVMLERGGKDPEVRRIRGNFRFDELVSVVRNMWNCAPKRLTLEYVDDEGDRVRVGSDLEWDEAVQLHAETQGALKLYARRGRHTKKADGRAEDDSSDNEETPVSEVPSVVAPVVASAVVQAPRVPPLAVDRAVLSDALTRDEVEQAEQAVEAHPDPEPTLTPTALAEAAARDADVTMELLSRLYDCDAAKEMLDMFTRVDFSPVVTRRVDAVAQEIHVDVDKIALRHLTVTRTNLWIGNGLYEKAESTLEAALKVWPDDAVLEYNTACAASLRGELEKSLGYLRFAVAHGYRNASQIRRDPDLAHVRDHPDFGSVLLSMADPTRGTVADAAPVPVPVTPVEPAPVTPVPTPDVRQETDVDRLLAVFPHLTVAEAKGLVRRFGSLSGAVNHCLGQV